MLIILPYALLVIVLQTLISNQELTLKFRHLLFVIWQQTTLNMVVLGTLIINRGSFFGLTGGSLVPKAIRTIAALSPSKNQAISNSFTISSSGCSFQFVRNSAHHASLATAMKNAAKPLVICGPSGVGKSSIIQKVQAEFPDCFGLCVSHTTRKPRQGEVDGLNYHFVNKAKFFAAKEGGEFVETAEFAGNMYGTSRGAINRVQAAGLICILDIEMKGVYQIKKTPGVNPHYVFIRPPSLEDLEVRLRERKTETEESIKKRLAIAEEEMEYGSIPDNFDLIIVNDTLDNAVDKLRDYMVIHIEELRRFRQLLAKR